AGLLLPQHHRYDFSGRRFRGGDWRALLEPCEHGRRLLRDAGGSCRIDRVFLLPSVCCMGRLGVVCGRGCGNGSRVFSGRAGQGKGMTDLITVEEYYDVARREDVIEELHWGRLVELPFPKAWHIKLRQRFYDLLRERSGTN